MRGRRVLVIYMNTMTVNGGVKMVISQWKATNEVYISIPEYLDMNTSLIRLESGICNPYTIKYGDCSNIAIQPCLWAGSIQPIILKLTPAYMEYIRTWDVDTSIIFPIYIYMCVRHLGLIIMVSSLLALNIKTWDDQTQELFQILCFLCL